ncbi:fibronectin type III domain-containing protein [uncultured Jatrophihabitans sp.]|uniref:fibronectin type III domain-containing protein n=1 Tax=uncultured Jatrophihabitans sp. TaxID=1610747 RepID=UPI0035CA9993
MHIVIKRTLGTATALAITTGALLAGAGVGAGAASASAAASASTACQTNCITNLTVGGTPEGVRFDFDTSALSRVKVIVTDDDGTKPYLVKDDNSWGSSYDLPVNDASRFTQGKAYRYLIYATDTGGSTWMRAGGFATLIRYASVTYNKFHVIKDGDSIGAGDFEGRSRCGNDDTWNDYATAGDHALSPLNSDPDHEIELSDGQEIPLFQKTPCHGTVGPTIEAQTAAADDDYWGYFDTNMDRWVPDSPSYYEKWTQSNFDEAYTRTTIADPLAPTATGSATTPLYAVSPGYDPLGYVANMRYWVTGIASFTHVVPDVPVKSDASGPATLGVTIEAGEFPTEATVSWNPTAFPAVGGPSASQVQWRAQGTNTWNSMGFLDVDEHEFPMENLKPATTYDFVVSRVLGNGLTALASRATFTTAAQTTTIYNWPTDTVTKPLGATVTAKVHVDGAAGRPVEIQYHQTGLPWTVYSTAHTDSTGQLTVAIKLGAGYTMWRLHALANGSYAEQATSARMLVAKTAIAGFDSTSKTAKTGSQLSNTITITPGAGRMLNLSYRKAGTTAWKLSKQLTAGATGKATLTEPVQSGKYEWTVNVPAAAYHGTAAVTAVRTITGT